MAIKQHKAHDARSALDEHVHLRAFVEDVRQTLEGRQASCEQIAKLFQQLAQNVLEHFDHEEAGGYFAEVIEIAPRLSHRVDALHYQHPVMARQLADLQECATGTTTGQRWWREVDERFSQFLRIFLEHETKENTLLQEAFNEDIGAED